MGILILNQVRVRKRYKRHFRNNGGNLNDIWFSINFFKHDNDIVISRYKRMSLLLAGELPG